MYPTQIYIPHPCYIHARWKNGMNKAPLLLSLTIIAALCNGQSTIDSAKPDLSKFTTNQLEACRNDPTICGTDKSWAIDDELTARQLQRFSVDQLLACYADSKICGVEESRPTGWPISDFLANRGDPHDLLVRYWTERNWIIRNGIERVAYHFDTPEVTAFMQRAVRERVDDGEELYWPANYLAKKCDPTGLSWLRTGRGRSQGGLQYETTLMLFGKCGYRPAIPLLVEALYDFSGNVTSGAEESLDALYPDHPKNLDWLPEIEAYYCGRARKEGFRVHCSTKLPRAEANEKTGP
jgi:hypothetical protein